MAGKQREPRGQADEEQAGTGVLLVDGSEGNESQSSAGVRVDRVVSGATLSDAALHQSVSNEDGGGAGVPSEGKGEVENVPGYVAPLAEEARREAPAALGMLDGEPLLDAAYADLGDPRSEALSAVMEVVIGTDDRTQIIDTTILPWRMVCSLRITAASGSQFIGTGWLVGARTLITAGHCVFMHAHGGWVRQIEVIAGRNGASRPFGSCTATSFRSVSAWTTGHDRDFDYGAILLPSACRLGDRVGFFGIAALSDAELLNLTLNLSGYPGDKPSGTQWFMARRATSVTPRTIVYNIDTAGGQSGAPVWRMVNGQRHAVGIHTNGALAGNSATRIVPNVAANIAAWKAAAP